MNIRRHSISLVFLLALVQIYFAAGSRVVFPSGPYPEFNTPVMTNGFVGAPSDFSVTANITIQSGCTPFVAPGMIVISTIGLCHISDKYEATIEAGAVGFVFCGFEGLGIGRISRVPISKTPLDIPAVIISFPDFGMLTGIFEATGTTYITIEITPGVSEWHTTAGNTGWFIALNILFGVFYIALLGLVIYKLVRKIKATGFILNISFVYLFFQGVFCILMIVRWIDPVLTWGIISHDADAFMDTWPATWSFAALVLMAFFWFEVINQFADTKVQAFLTKKMQVPFWILVAIIILLPAINSIIIGYAVNLDLIVALLIIPFIAGMIVACFYIIVAVKALQVVKRSERLNVDKKSRVRGLMRSRVSIIISTIIACLYPPCNFFLRYYILSGNLYLALAAIYEESVFLGLVAFIQVWFMPDKSPGMSTTSNRSHSSLNSYNMTKDENTTTSANSTHEV